MEYIIFAGGAGTRLWPISRVSSPKQFAPLKDGKSTLELAVERIGHFGWDHIFISANTIYTDYIRTQVPHLPSDHIFSEPVRRDVAPAVGLALLRLKKRGVSGPVAVLWADHFMDRPEVFVDALKKAESIVKMQPNQFVFLGEKPRFANQNLGWMRTGEQIEEGRFAFKEWTYRPKKEVCDEMFASGEWFWNPGYFIFDIDFCLSLYQTHQPTMYTTLSAIVENEAGIESQYELIEAVSFDNAIVEKLSPDQATVIAVDMGWSDPGTLYALKEAFVPSLEENYTQGNVVTLDTKDSFVYNEVDGKLVATIGLDGVCVVNTGDALLVCQKNDVPRIKELLQKMREEGLEKYL